jgi:hypothetical protein
MNAIRGPKDPRNPSENIKWPDLSNEAWPPYRIPDTGRSVCGPVGLPEKPDGTYTPVSAGPQSSGPASERAGGIDAALRSFQDVKSGVPKLSKMVDVP